MELNKLLKTRLHLKTAPLTGRKLAIRVLELISQTLEADIGVLSKDDELFEQGFSKLTLFKGAFEADKKQGKDDQPPYIFIQIKDKPGLLLEVEDERLRLVRATRVVPLLADVSGQPVRPTLFVGHGSSLEEFLILDEETVRTQESKRTLSLEQCSEMLLVLAFDELR